MGIIVNSNTRVLIQGITGKQGSFHTKFMLEYGTQILAGVTPGKKGEKVHGVPVFNTVHEAVEAFPEINSSLMFVPAPYVADAVYEAIDSGIKLIVIISERVPIHDSIQFINYAKQKNCLVIGPNCPGIITPPSTKLGIMPNHLFKAGNIGLVSRSGTLTYEIAYKLLKNSLGISTAVGIGGDPIIGTDFIEIYDYFLKDKSTSAVVLVGEIGGDMEERFSDFYNSLKNKKPVVAFVAGRSAPEGKRMGHAGAIISMGMGSAKSKVEKFKEVGIPVADRPDEIPILLKSLLNK
jgi:succinyl-CoA synthetase alpha subunit